MENVTIEGYEVREPRIADIPNFFTLMQKPTEVITETLLRYCVFKDGVMLGDRISELPVRLVMPLMHAVMRAAGLGSEGKD